MCVGGGAPRILVAEIGSSVLGMWKQFHRGSSVSAFLNIQIEKLSVWTRIKIYLELFPQAPYKTEQILSTWENNCMSLWLYTKGETEE